MRHLLAPLAALTLAAPALADDWLQWMGPNRDGVWSEKGILERFPKGGLKAAWRAPVAGGYAGPAVAGGLVYVFDFDTPDAAREKPNPGRPKAPLKGKERVHCLDAKTGKPAWVYDYPCSYTVSYPAGPRCTPTVSGGKVYTLGAEGDLHCLDAKKGTLVWKKDFKSDYGTKTPLWGFTGHPLIEGDTLVCLVGGKDALLVAFDKDTGKERWKALDAAEPGYCSPSVLEHGGKRQLILWDPEKIHSLDPATGKPYWSVPLAPKYAMSIMAPRQGGDYLFAGGIGPVNAAFKLDGIKEPAEVWRGSFTRGVSPVNMTPIVDGGTLYGVDQPGELLAVDLKTGKRLWSTYKPTTGGEKANSGTAFLVKNGERTFILGEKGVLTLARLTPKGYEELDSAQVLEPTGFTFGRAVLWSPPAFANKCMYARNDKEVVCVSLAAD